MVPCVTRIDGEPKYGHELLAKYDNGKLGSLPQSDPEFPWMVKSQFIYPSQKCSELSVAMEFVRSFESLGLQMSSQSATGVALYIMFVIVPYITFSAVKGVKLTVVDARSCVSVPIFRRVEDQETGDVIFKKMPDVNRVGFYLLVV
jgi:hypothetical protein